MGSVLKLVYDHWFYKDSKKYNLPNAIHPKIVTKITNIINEQNCWYDEALTQFESNGQTIPFNIASFSNYFKNNFPTDIVSIDEIDFDTNNIFIYLVEIRFQLNSLYTASVFSNENTDYEYFLKDTIPKKSLELLKKGKLKLLIELTHEPIYLFDQVNSFENYLESIGIESSNVIIMSGNDFIEEYYKFYPNSKIKLISSELLITYQNAIEAHKYPQITDIGYISDIVRKNDLNPNFHRKKVFLCFNRTMKPHRYVMAYYALKYNLLENNIFSFINDHGQSVEHIFNCVKNLAGDDDDILKNVIKMKQMIPYEIDTQYLPFDKKRGFSNNNNKKEWYLDTYIHLTTETCFETSSIFFSEKTWRPITNLQPFIYIGNYHALAKLKDLGFKTFHPFIDESYDLETNHSTRINLIKKEILKLNNKSIQEIHEWYYSITDILLHNQTHFMSFKDIKPYDKALNNMLDFYKDEIK